MQKETLYTLGGYAATIAGGYLGLELGTAAAEFIDSSAHLVGNAAEIIRDIIEPIGIVACGTLANLSSAFGFNKLLLKGEKGLTK
jgi:hypothetical protein